MAENGLVPSPSGVAIPVEGEATAQELALLVRAATRDLPFGAEPAAFLAALERLAPAGDDEA
jgi:hypothetical protein